MDLCVNWQTGFYTGEWKWKLEDRNVQGQSTWNGEKDNSVLATPYEKLRSSAYESIASQGD